MDTFVILFSALCVISMLSYSAVLSDAYVFGPRTSSWRQRKFYDDQQQDEQTQPFGFNTLWSFAPFNKNEDTVGTPFASGYGKMEALPAPQPNAMLPPSVYSDQQLSTVSPIVSGSDAMSGLNAKILSKWAKFLFKEQQQQNALTAASGSSTTTVAPLAPTNDNNDSQQLPPLRRLGHDNDVKISPLERNVYEVQENRRARPVRVELGEVEEHDDLPSLSI